MKYSKSDFRALTAALAFGVLVLGAMPATTLASTYDATAEFTFTLNNVVDETGTQVTSGWEVFAEGDGDAFLSVSGDAFATGDTRVLDPGLSLGIGDTIIQSSTSSGEAVDGLAATDALTNLDITFDNFLDETLIFSFGYDVSLDALTTGDAEASASVDMLDNLGLLDILASSVALSGPANDDSDGNTTSLHGEAQFELFAGEFNLISGYVDTWGWAVAEPAANVPEPVMLLLMATGLAAVGFASRNKRQA